MPPDTYSHGHHESVLRSHRWRTAENSAAYLLPHLAPGQSLLDVGCGPGNITLDLAARVAPGPVLGIDAAEDAVAAANEINTAPDHVTFAVGDVYALDAPDATYDVVHAHQVLQHLSHPVDALREMRRVTRPGGVVAARDGVYASFAWAPDDPLLVRWNQLYHQITEHNRAEADAGRYLLGWAQQAGFTDVTASSSTWTFADPESRARGGAGSGRTGWWRRRSPSRPSSTATPIAPSSRRSRRRGAPGPSSPTAGSPCSTPRSSPAAEIRRLAVRARSRESGCTRR